MVENMNTVSQKGCGEEQKVPHARCTDWGRNREGEGVQIQKAVLTEADQKVDMELNRFYLKREFLPNLQWSRQPDNTIWY